MGRRAAGAAPASCRPAAPRPAAGEQGGWQGKPLNDGGAHMHGGLGATVACPSQANRTRACLCAMACCSRSQPLQQPGCPTWKAEGCSTAVFSSPTAVSIAPTGSMRSTCTAAAGRAGNGAAAGSAWQAGAARAATTAAAPCRGTGCRAALPTCRTPMGREPIRPSAMRMSCGELSGMLRARQGGGRAKAERASSSAARRIHCGT